MRMIEVTDTQRQEVEALLQRRDLAPRQRERLEMVKAVGLGQDEATIARWSGRGIRTVRRWLARFVEGGAATLVDAPRSGRPVEADAAYLRALDAAVKTPPTTLGLPFDVWTSPRLSVYVARERGVRIAPGWLRRKRQDSERNRVVARVSLRRCPSGIALRGLQHRAHVAPSLYEEPPLVR